MCAKIKPSCTTAPAKWSSPSVPATRSSHTVPAVRSSRTVSAVRSRHTVSAVRSSHTVPVKWSSHTVPAKDWSVIHWIEDEGKKENKNDDSAAIIIWHCRSNWLSGFKPATEPCLCHSVNSCTKQLTVHWCIHSSSEELDMSSSQSPVASVTNHNKSNSFYNQFLQVAHSSEKRSWQPILMSGDKQVL